MVAVEADPVWAERLTGRLAGLGCPRPSSSWLVTSSTVPLPSEPYRVLSNPPYGITTALLRRLFDRPEHGPYRADLLLQWEVARKRSQMPPSPAALHDLGAMVGNDDRGARPQVRLRPGAAGGCRLARGDETTSLRLLPSRLAPGYARFPPSRVGPPTRRTLIRWIEMRVVEVGPRDGLQNEAVELSTIDKVELIDRLVDAGLSRIEAVSFAHPERVPQMADAEEVMAALPTPCGASLIGLVMNWKGWQRAAATDVDEVNMPVFATETFNERNQGVPDRRDRRRTGRRGFRRGGEGRDGDRHGERRLGMSFRGRGPRRTRWSGWPRRSPLPGWGSWRWPTPSGWPTRGRWSGFSMPSAPPSTGYPCGSTSTTPATPVWPTSSRPSRTG